MSHFVSEYLFQCSPSQFISKLSLPLSLSISIKRMLLVRRRILLLVNGKNGSIQVLLVGHLVLDLLFPVLVHVFRALLHLLLHKGLRAGQPSIPCLKFGHDIVHSIALDVATVCAGNVQSFVFLVKSALEKRIVDAIDDFIFELSDVLDAENAHHVLVGHHGLF